jgi:hypothetical protein
LTGLRTTGVAVGTMMMATMVMMASTVLRDLGCEGDMP